MMLLSSNSTSRPIIASWMPEYLASHFVVISYSRIWIGLGIGGLMNGKSRGRVYRLAYIPPVFPYTSGSLLLYVIKYIPGCRG
jgi:hypothetical protein